MRIGVNAVPLRVWGGGARYCFTNLMDAMLSRDDGHEYIIFTHFLGLPVVNELLAVHRHLGGSGRARIVEVADEIGVLRSAAEFDVYFAPLNNLQPRIHDRPTVAILHDIQEQYFPQFFSPGDLEARREIYPEICRAATTLVTISEFCKQSIVEKFNIDPAKIEVVYNAPQRALVARDPSDRGVWRDAPLPERFVFYPANFYPHKNHAVLLDAIRILRERRSPNVPDVVFTGFEVDGGPRIHDEIRRRGLSDICRVLPKVDEDALRHLYTTARALVMPTLFEGFGMPAVEALACGCPFIAADIPALREVAGDAAAYFDPADPHALADHIDRFVAQDQRSQPIVARGLQYASKFSWSASAERMIQIIERAPSRFFGFSPCPGCRAPDNAPTIGVQILADRGDMGVPESLKSLWATGYPNIRIEVVSRHTPLTHQCTHLLDSVPIPHRHLSNGETDARLLLDFARRGEVHLAAQIWAGNGVTASAMHSLCDAYLRDPNALIFVGESWVCSGAVVTNSARLRLRSNEWWTLEGFLYPGMIYFRPAALERAVADAARVPANAHWRWELLKALRSEGRMCLMRRTLNAAQESSVTFWTRMRASLDSSLDDGSRPRTFLERAEPAVRLAGKLLPRNARSAGKRIWEHLKREA